MAELTYMNRTASAGLLSASLAHEVNQPLTGIVTRANAAMRWLSAELPTQARHTRRWHRSSKPGIAQPRSS